MVRIDEQQKELRKELRSFVENNIMPWAEELDQSGVFPKELFRQLGRQGYLDMSIYNQRPDSRYNTVESTIIIEEIARGLPSLALSVSPHVHCMNLIALYGTEKLKSRLLSDALNGDIMFGFAISEASGGSEALAIDTTATFVGDGWILNGEKCWITNAGVADGYIVAAKNAYSGKYRDVSLFYVDANNPGLDDKSRIALTGMNNSPTGNIRLTNCKVSAECLVGKENEAYNIVKVLLNEGRLQMSALAVGMAQSSMESTIEHTSTSGRYGHNLASYQGVSFQVARMYEKIFMARNSLYAVADMFQNQQRATMEVAALKLFSAEMCMGVCRSAVQLHGARGLKKFSTVERNFRDCQVLTITEGSSEICQLIISGKLYHSYLDGNKALL
jgi:alkylation response protein AidB-like acyl-CoA dehydrogenase